MYSGIVLLPSSLQAWPQFLTTAEQCVVWLICRRPCSQMQHNAPRRFLSTPITSNNSSSSNTRRRSRTNHHRHQLFRSSNTHGNSCTSSRTSHHLRASRPPRPSHPQGDLCDSYFYGFVLVNDLEPRKALCWRCLGCLRCIEWWRTTRVCNRSHSFSQGLTNGLGACACAWLGLFSDRNTVALPASNQFLI